VLREPRIADLDQLTEIERRSFRAHRFSRRQFRYYIHTKSSIFAVAEYQDRLVGYIAGAIHGNTGRCAVGLYSMAVLSRWRGLGIASALLRFFERKAAHQKCRTVVLQVRETNRAARALYKKFGYERDAILLSYYGPGKNGLRLQKLLRGGP
jgi:ribosomal protein S18 acetylase RimI-like enzyme